MRILLFSIPLAFCLGIESFAQSPMEINQVKVEDVIENSAEQFNESNQNEIPEELQNLSENPIDINGNEIEILYRFNLITETQLKSIQNYRNKMGDLVEPEELQQVDGFEKKTILAIAPFITVRKTKKEQSSNRLTFRVQKIKNTNADYFAGSDLKVLFRYQLTLSNSLKISYTGEIDAGEEFFSRRTKAFDFNSFHVYYNGNHMIKKIILGDYNLEYGQGLTTWTGLNFGSGVNITGIYKSGRGIIPYSGTDENKFFRGIAFSLKKGKLSADTWFSHHGIDGNFIYDTISGGQFISSFQTSGYHRSWSEITDHHSQHETAFGGTVNFSNKRLNTGLVASYQRFSLPFSKNEQPYAMNKFSGINNLNIGWNYSYSYKNILIFGEIATDRNYSFAYLNGMILSIDSRMSFGILTRSYSQQFISLKSNAFGVNSENANEMGTYIGLNYKIIRPISLSCYTDVYSFPFLKYRVDKPTNGYDLFSQIDLTPTKKFTSQFRYRKRLKQQNYSEDFTGLNILADNISESFRFSSRFKIGNDWDYSCKIELSIAKNNYGANGKGTVISQDIFYHPMGKKYSFNIRYAIFNCPDFENRIYSYENDVQGAFSVPFYYGSGSRFYMNVNLKVHRSIAVSLRYAISWIDEEMSTIEKADFKIQTKILFR